VARFAFLDRATSRLPRRWRIALEWVVTLACAVAFVLAFEAEIAQPYRVPSASMEPTLHCAKPAVDCQATFSDRIIACKICYAIESPKRGQIVAFTSPPAAKVLCGEGGTYVKRLIGLPGETVREDRASHIWIDGHELAESYVSAEVRASDLKFRGDSWHVPSGSYFMLGDSRGDSCDSRMWGSVPRASLIGPAVVTYWPPNRLTVR
jgi:signal peptidase I